MRELSRVIIRQCDVTARLCFRYWPVIDNALREAAFERNVRVRVMASWWKHSRPSLLAFLRSLEALNAAQSTVYHRNMSVQVVCEFAAVIIVPYTIMYVSSCFPRRKYSWFPLSRQLREVFRFVESTTISTWSQTTSPTSVAFLSFHRIFCET